MRQAAGCWRTQRPCTSEATTQHSSFELHHKLIIPIARLFCKSRQGVSRRASALILCGAEVIDSAPLLCFRWSWAGRQGFSFAPPVGLIHRKF